MRRVTFLRLWVISGTVITLFFVWNPSELVYLQLLALLMGTVGLGFPLILSFFAEVNELQKRGNSAGVVLMLSFLTILGMLVIIQPLDLSFKILVFALWRASGLSSCFVIRIRKEKDEISSGNISFWKIVRRKDFLFYFIPWLLVGFVNQIEVQLYFRFFEARFVGILMAITFLAAAISAFVAGLLADRISRKLLTIGAFAALGLGYAALSLTVSEFIALTSFFVFDGAAWGVLLMLYTLVLWGDLSERGGREETYALGITPPFLGLAVAPFVSHLLASVPISNAFSLGALFLFLSLIPLVYAPETLPKDLIEKREMQKYIEKAKKLKEEGSSK